MKKTYLIMGGSVIVLLLIFIWVYLLIYGTPKPVENFFTDFSFAGDTDNTPLPPPSPEIYPDQVDIGDAIQLKQLTLKPVIGFGEKVNENSGEPTILYAEAGTGHVFSINLISGTETRLSNITIPNAQKAQFSPDGTLAAIRSGYGNQNSIELLSLAGENNATKETLLPTMIDFTFNTNNQLLYSEYNSSGLLGKEFNTTTKTTRTLFSVPFQNATIKWSLSSTTPHYAYPKASASLPGFLYSLSGGVVKRLPYEGKGLTSLSNEDYIVTTVQTGRGPVSKAYGTDGKSVTSLVTIIDPNKCAFSKVETNIIYCGAHQDGYGPNYPDDWYKGTRSFSDKLWRVSANQGNASQLISPETVVGRAIDVTNLHISNDNGVLYFINKNDNTLWMYEI